MRNLVPVDKITHVDELLAYDGSAFIDMAYRVLLRRDADAQGRGHYLDRLQGGDGKDAIIHALFTSPEFRRVPQDSEIVGVADLAANWRRRHRSRGFFISLRDLPKSLRDLQELERKLNQLEYSLAERAWTSERVIECRVGTEATSDVSQIQDSTPSEGKRSLEVRRGKSAFLTLLNFEAAIRASPMARSFAR
jgi:hypothetical protein